MLEFNELRITGDAFMGYVKDGKIYNNNNILIGRTEDEYQAVVKTAEEFQEVLYNHNILERPKTPEQINQELQDQLKQQSDTMKEMVDAMAMLKSELNNIKENKNAKKNSNEPVKSQA